MSERCPRIRTYLSTGALMNRDGLRFCFFLNREHREVAPFVMRSLERYAATAGPALGQYFDDSYWHRDGYEQDLFPLDDKGWSRIRARMQNASGAYLHLVDEDARQERFKFRYRGFSSNPIWPNSVCGIEFWLSTEYLEEHGPGHVRELALDMVGSLPFCSGDGGFSFNTDSWEVNSVRVIDDATRFRYLGMTCLGIEHGVNDLGTRIQNISWMTFLGQPVLGEVGGVAGLRSKLHSPGTTVQTLDENRVVVTLGLWPEAGDMEKGQSLPAYRELARVLEPWLDIPALPEDATPEEVQHYRWRRRFLD